MKTNRNVVLYEAIYLGFISFLIYASLTVTMAVHSHLTELYSIRERSPLAYFGVGYLLDIFFSFPVISVLLCMGLAVYRVAALYPNFVYSDWEIYRSNSEGIFVTDLIAVILLNTFIILHAFSLTK